MSSRTEHPVSSSGFKGRTQAAAVIRTAGPADMAALGDFFATLSTQARYLRFLAPVTPAPALLRVLSGGRASVDVIVAVRYDVIIGHAMAADQPATDGPRRPRTVQDPPGADSDRHRRSGRRCLAGTGRRLGARARAGHPGPGTRCDIDDDGRATPITGCSP